MKLDSRILECKKPLTCFDIEKAKLFEGQKGYFSHYIDNYADLKNTVLGTLGSTGDTFHESFCCTEEPFDNYYYEFFMPAEWVKPEEPKKKYRPYSLEEFLKIFDVGDQIKFKSKDNGEVKCAMFIGYADGFFADTDSSDDKKMPGENDVMIGIYRYSLAYLFENYELFFMGHWQPFGIEVKEKE